MKLEDIIKGVECCSEFLCKECPYKKYDSSDYILRCMHKLISDVNKNIDQVLRGAGK